MPERQSGTIRRKEFGKTNAWLVAAIAIALAGAGGFAWQRSQSSENSDAAPPEFSLPLETFVVNISSGQRAYLRVGITLGLARPLLANKAEAPMVAPVRDTILGILSAGQAEELVKSEGKKQLKEQLLKALQERVPQLGVVNVYFTEFLVQM